MARLFNAYVIVDWSAASKPTTGADSVWVGVLKRDVRFRMAFEAHNPADPRRGREADRRHPRRPGQAQRAHPDRLRLHPGLPARPRRRPEAAGRDAAVAGGLEPDRPDGEGQGRQHQQPLRRRLGDQPAAHRRAVPVLGRAAEGRADHPAAEEAARDTAPATSPEFRHAELAAKGSSPVWKLYYQGSVGGQAILGIPMVRRLKLARGEAMKVWPFETGWKALTEADLAGVDVVAAEVYPSLFKARPLPARSRTSPKCAPPPNTSPASTRRASWAPVRPAQEPPPTWCSTPNAKKAGCWGPSLACPRPNPPTSVIAGRQSRRPMNTAA